MPSRAALLALALAAFPAHADPPGPTPLPPLSFHIPELAPFLLPHLPKLRRDSSSYLDEALALGLDKLTKSAGRLYGIGGVGPLVHVETSPKAFIIGIRLGAGEPTPPR